MFWNNFLWENVALGALKNMASKKRIWKFVHDKIVQSEVL